MLMIEPNPITPASRDHELLRMLAQGYSNKVIASPVNVSPLAAKKQIQAFVAEDSGSERRGPDSRTNDGEHRTETHSPQHKRLKCTSTGCPVRNATPIIPPTCRYAQSASRQIACCPMRYRCFQ